MQDITAAFANEIRATRMRDYRQLVDLVEIYDPDETDFVPSNALYRWSTRHITWGAHTYERMLLGRGQITRFYGGEFNEVTYTLANVQRALGGLFFSTNLEGYILLHRIVSAGLDDGASYVVPFVGRCQKAVETDKVRGTLRARQFLGHVETPLPPRTASHRCPLLFKGEECLGNEVLASKSATYQAASVCTKDYDQCKAYGNEKFFQGFRFQSAQGTFKFKTTRGGAGGALLSLLGLGRKKVTKAWSTQDDGIVGKSIPLVLGRAQLNGIPLAHADTGTAIAFVVVWCEGKVNAIKNVRVVTAGFDPPQTVVNRLGDWGGTGTQVITGTFAGTPVDYNSRTAFTSGVSFGDNPDTGEPAPEVAALILGIELTTPTLDGSYTALGYSDNPVDIARYLITAPKLLNHPEALWDDWAAYKIWRECNEPLQDASKGEQILFSNVASGVAGVDWKIYRSSSVFDVHWLRFLLGLTTDHPSTREITYGFYNPSAPPTSVAPTTYLRKRYTCNIAVSAEDKAVDFLFKNIFSTARMYIVTGADGKLQVRREKPSVSTLLRNDIAIGDTVVGVEDVFEWRNYYKPLVLLGVGELTSEVREVASVRHSLAGNNITVAVSGGTTTLATSGATFAGATDTTPAKVTLTVGGSASAGQTITATIDGVACSYTLTADDTLATAAGMLAAHINANTTLNRYVKAVWSGYPDVYAVRWERETYFQIAGASVTAQINTSATASGNPNGKLTGWVQSKDTITEDGQAFAFQVQNQAQANASSLDALMVVGLTALDNPTPTPVVNGSQTYATFAEPEYQFYFALGTGNVPVAYARTASGGLITGELAYTTNSSFRIARVNSTTIKWYIDGVEVASLTTAVPATLRLAAVAGRRILPSLLQPRVLHARFIDALSGSDTTIKLISKLGWLDLTEPCTQPHSIGQEAIYVAMLFSDRAQDVNARSNIVADSTKFPVAARQSSINQVKLTYTDPLMDFQQVTLTVNDYDHQSRTRTVKSASINAQGVDSYHQAERLANNYLAKLRDCDFFVEWASGANALGLEEGDVVAISSDIAGAGENIAYGTRTERTVENYYLWGHGAPITRSDGVAQGPYPKFGDNSWGAVEDGSGGFYVFGGHAHVDDDANYARLTHIVYTSGRWEVDTNFQMALNSDVQAAVRDGDTLYIAGDFTSVGGQPRNRLAAIDLTTNTVTAWNPNVNGFIGTMLKSGNTIYIGGNFSTVGGTSRPNVAAISTTTGLLTSFNANVNGNVWAMAISGSTLYIGGYFTTVGGNAQVSCAAVNATTGAHITAFAPDFSGGWGDKGVYAMALYGGFLYIGGRFQRVNGVDKTYFAAISATTGASGSLSAAELQYTANGFVNSMAVIGSTLYIGGGFIEINGSGLFTYSGARTRLASFDLTTGLINDWAPNVLGDYYPLNLFSNDYVTGITPSSDNNTLFIAGYYLYMNDDQPREEVLTTTITNVTSSAQRLYNLPVRLEEVRIDESPFAVALVGRKYQSSAYSDNVSVRTVPLVSGVTLG